MADQEQPKCHTKVTENSCVLVGITRLSIATTINAIK